MIKKICRSLTLPRNDKGAHETKPLFGPLEGPRARIAGKAVNRAQGGRGLGRRRLRGKSGGDAGPRPLPNPLLVEGAGGADASR